METKGKPMANPDPARIRGDLIKDFYARMGFDPETIDRVLRIEVDPQCVWVTRHRQDVAGRLIMAGGHVAVETIDVGVDWRPQDSEVSA